MNPKKPIPDANAIRSLQPDWPLTRVTACQMIGKYFGVYWPHVVHHLNWAQRHGFITPGTFEEDVKAKGKAAFEPEQVAIALKLESVLDEMGLTDREIPQGEDAAITNVLLWKIVCKDRW